MDFPLPNIVKLCLKICNLFSKEKQMKPMSIFSALIVGLLAVLASNHLVTFSPILTLRHFYSTDLVSLSSSILSNLSPYCSFIPVSRRHHHWRHDDTKERKSPCDDFPPNFPPPDTNTTSTFCVDSRGCCNFTTVQAAVNAVANFSQKRNILWINSGIYL